MTNPSTKRPGTPHLPRCPSVSSDVQRTPSSVVQFPPAIRRAWALFRLIHPFPTLLNVVAVALFAALAARGLPPLSPLARLMAAMFCTHACIGAVNDLVDRDLDAATKPYKPLVWGGVTPTEALLVALALLAALLALYASLGWPALLIGAAGTGIGLAYDLRLKRTIWSGLTWGLALPLQPLIAWVRFGHFTPSFLWILPLGFLMGLALHLANTLPDLEGDTSYGVRGLAHALGHRRALALSWLCLAAANAGAVLLHLVGAVPGNGPILYLAAFASILLVVSSAALVLWRPTPQTWQWNFGVLAISAVVLAGGWLAALAL
jgi:4-hydroxybenzoate polyprenyltransferase